MTTEQIFNLLVESRRGDFSAEEFLRPDYQRDLCDPWLLPDIKQAVERLKEARDKKQKVWVYGDYDIDGLTAATIFHEACKTWGIQIEVYIPSRFTEGYGLSKTGIQTIAKQGADLIVTVDCGSLSVEEVAYANSLGVDVIVTDHHAVGEVLPEAVAVINPKRTDSAYPHSNLAGVGVVFKLIQAAQTVLDGLPVGQEKWLLDLVALGTVCDQVPLIGENRALVHFGLLVARQGRRPGLGALCQTSGSELGHLTAEDFGFRLGPRLNASGRLDSAKISLQLLQTNSALEADGLALQLEAANTERRQLQDKIAGEALALAEKDESEVLILADKSWSHGVVGIVAAKVMHKLKKPTIIMQIIGDTVKGSARSFGDFDLSKALESVRPLLITGGGHAYAAGCSIALADLGAFRQSVNDYFASLRLTDHHDQLSRAPDVQLNTVAPLDLALAEKLSQLEPFGQANAKPIFAIKNLKVTDQRLMGSQKTHCRLLVEDSSGSGHEIVCFNEAAAIADMLTKTELVHPLVNLSINRFRGRVSPQLQLIEWAN